MLDNARLKIKSSQLKNNNNKNKFGSIKKKKYKHLVKLGMECLGGRCRWDHL
jgi:hypothetical protein